MFGSLLLFIAAAIVKLVQGDDINVSVGEGGLEISHPSFDASIGDVLVFGFGVAPGGTNYSIVQGTYDKPCFALEGGFFSGFLPVPANEQASQFVFRVTVNTTDPIYYYCGQTGDCQAGMVATVNAPYDAPGSFVDYQSAARMVTSVGPLPTAVMGGEIVQLYTYSTTTTSSMSSSSTTPPQSNTTSSTTSNSSPTTGSSQMTSTSGSSSSAPSTTSSSTMESSSTTESSGSSSTESTVSSITSKLPSNGTSTSTSTSTSTPQPVLNQGISVHAWNTQILLFALLAFAAIML